MAKTDQELLEGYKERIRRQNSRIKENYDKVTATLPKGTIDRIRALGLTINGVINESLIAFLERLEERGRAESIQIDVNAETKTKEIKAMKSTKEPRKPEIKADTALQADSREEGHKPDENSGFDG